MTRTPAPVSPPVVLFDHRRDATALFAADADSLLDRVGSLLDALA